MTDISADLDPLALRQAWSQLRSSGQASPTIARLLQVGVGQFLDAFAKEYLGTAGLGQGMKLVLGANGEGKTHLLYCLRERALLAGHAVSFVEATSAALGESPFAFAQEVLRQMQTLESMDSAEARVPALIRASVARKRAAAQASGLDPAPILLAWARGLRNKDLHPHGLSQALADAVLAAIDDDDDALRTHASAMTFEGTRQTKAQAEQSGAQLLASLPVLVRLLGFGPLVVLVDEAELAVQKQGKQRMKRFLEACRFMNDHVANGDRAPCLVLTCCSSDFWPNQFQQYEALYQRLCDPARETPEERRGLKVRTLAKCSKLWVQETFRGELADYRALGTAVVALGARVHPDVDVTTQAKNVEAFARAASSRSLLKPVKRYFIKALAAELDTQLDNECQRECTQEEAFRALDTAIEQIQQHDETMDTGA